MKEINIGDTYLRIFRNQNDVVSIEIEGGGPYGMSQCVYFDVVCVDAVCAEMQRIKKEIEEEKDNG